MLLQSACHSCALLTNAAVRVGCVQLAAHERRKYHLSLQKGARRRTADGSGGGRAAAEHAQHRLRAGERLGAPTRAQPPPPSSLFPSFDLPPAMPTTYRICHPELLVVAHWRQRRRRRQRPLRAAIRVGAVKAVEGWRRGIELLLHRLLLLLLLGLSRHDRHSGWLKYWPCLDSCCWSAQRSGLSARAQCAASHLVCGWAGCCRVAATQAWRSACITERRWMCSHLLPPAFSVGCEIALHNRLHPAIMAC